MKYLFKSMLLIYTIVGFIRGGSVSINDIAVLLIIIALDIYYEKYNSSIYIIAAEAAAVTWGVSCSDVFAAFYSICIFNAIYLGTYVSYAITVFIVMLSFIFLKQDYYSMLIIFLAMGGLYGQALKKLSDNERKFKESYDTERRYRYEIEAAKQKLMNSAKEVAYLAEIKERNRIAQQIHDTIGHSIAGILMQLQAAYKIKDRNAEKSKELLSKSIEELSKSLTLLRDTVHNIKPSENISIEYIKNIIDNFKFCTVNFKCTGDFQSLPANYIEIISTNIKEALTNAAKYSSATMMDISIEVTERYVRLYIKDNGIGCDKIKEGIGISGMKERVYNIGGNVSISSEDGFLIVCFMPISEYKGEI